MPSQEQNGPHLVNPDTGPFRQDNWFGRLLLKDQEFLTEDGFLSFEDACQQIKSSEKKVILNIGDSSTSGWDTRVTVENKERKQNNQPLLSAFFRYATYSDMLREQVGDQYIVLNAGIPGHTTLQGRRRLEYLLARLAGADIKVDIVTIYFGNNDSQWERNQEDKEKLLSSRLLPLAVERWRARQRKPDHKHLRLRTNLRDFEANYRAMIRNCRRYGALPAIILPETPLYWKPGYRFVQENYEIDPNCAGYGQVKKALDKSSELWSSVMEKPWSAEKSDNLEHARELDFIVPRIKKGHRETLRSIARNEEIPLITTQIPRESDDICYFVDYCHPIDEANAMIVAELQKMLAATEAGRYSNNRKRDSLLLRILDSRVFDAISLTLNKVSRNKSSPASDTDQDIYTLY